MMNKNRNFDFNGKLWLFIAVFVLVIAVIVGMFVAQMVDKNSVSRAEGADSSEVMQDDVGFDENTIEWNGVTYTQNKELKNILLLGIDKNEQEIESTDLEKEPGGRADAIAVLVMNPQNKTVQVLEISRDTMTDIDIYGVDDVYLYSTPQQIALQYSVANSMRRGNWLMNNKVSELLYGVPMHGTVALTMDGISKIVDTAGGITLKLQEDYTQIDPAFEKGKTITLNGDQAYRFIRYRDTDVIGSNDDRMQRHIQVLHALTDKVHNIDDTTLNLVKKVAEPYLESDVDAQTLNELSQYEFLDTITVLPGETREGENHDEYYIDESALRELVIKTFYQPAE